MDIVTLTIVFLSAIVIGIFAVVMGGTLFLSLPLFQILFPEMALGAIVGNIKIGSVLRNAAALIPTASKLDWQVLKLAPILCLGSVLGSLQIVSVSTVIVPIVLITGLLIHEFGRRLKITSQLFWLIAFGVGFYGGIFGAGIMLLILSLLNLRYASLVEARAGALLLEMLLSIVAVAVFWQHELIVWPLALIWAGGGIIGGFAGGAIINRTGKLPPTIQGWLVRSVFLLALLVALLRLL